MFPFITLVSLHKVFVSFQVKFACVRCVGCEGEGTSGEEEGKVVREEEGVVRYQLKKPFYLKKML